jgi:hypothetical protein
MLMGPGMKNKRCEFLHFSFATKIENELLVSAADARRAAEATTHKAA